MANSVDPDEKAPDEAILSRPMLFANATMFVLSGIRLNTINKIGF